MQGWRTTEKGLRVVGGFALKKKKKPPQAKWERGLNLLVFAFRCAPPFLAEWVSVTLESDCLGYTD